MFFLKGIFDGKIIKLLEPIPYHKKKEVMVSILDDSPQTQNKITAKYVNYYQTLNHDEELENSSLEQDFSWTDAEAEEILKRQEGD